jgi:hypothetical protein
MNIYGYTIELKDSTYVAAQFRLKHKDSLSSMQRAIYKSLNCASEYVFIQSFSYRTTNSLDKIKDLVGFALPFTKFGIIERDISELKMLSDLTIKQITQIMERW